MTPAEHIASAEWYLDRPMNGDRNPAASQAHSLIALAQLAALTVESATCPHGTVGWCAPCVVLAGQGQLA